MDIEVVSFSRPVVVRDLGAGAVSDGDAGDASRAGQSRSLHPAREFAERLMDHDLSKDEIRALFDEVSTRAAKRGIRIEMFLVRGAAMALAYNTSRSTRDIDAIFEPKMLAYQIAAEVAAERGDLHEDWLNDAVKAFPMPDGGIDPAATVFYQDIGLVIRVASPRYLFAMKAWSARESDEDDLRILWPLCHFATSSEGLDYVEAAYPVGSLRPRSQYIVEQIASEFQELDCPSAPGASNGKLRTGVSLHRRDGSPISEHEPKRPES